MYLPEYPTWEEQRRSVSPESAGDTDGESGVGGDLAVDDADLALGDDIVVANAEMTATQLTDAGTTQGDGDGSGAGAGAPAVVPGRAVPAGRRTNRLAPVFGRRDITFTTDLEIPLTGSIVTDAGVANNAIAEAVAGDTGRLAYVLQGRAKHGVSVAALEAGEAAYEAELAERRTSQAPPLPSVEFLAAAARDPRGGWRVNLTLANTIHLGQPARQARPDHLQRPLLGSLRGRSVPQPRVPALDADWRTDPEVYAHGRFCVGEVEGQTVRPTPGRSTVTWSSSPGRSSSQASKTSIDLRSTCSRRSPIAWTASLRSGASSPHQQG